MQNELSPPSRLQRILAAWHIYIPLLAIAALVWPHVGFLLPAHTDLSDEVYQPLRTLKFFKSKGSEFHKYAPFPNLILAVPYAGFMGYWKVAGEFGSPSGDFPYGLKRPMEQLGVLVLVSRLTFVAVAMVMFGILAWATQKLVQNKAAVTLAMLLFAAGNTLLIWKLPVPEVDSPMLAFAAGAMAMYVLILSQGLTTRRWVLMTLFGVAAMSSKEVAGPLIVAMFISAGCVTFARSRRDPAAQRQWNRSALGIVVLGAVSYSLINIVYAPRLWWRRMEYWLAGEGLDSSVWGESTGWNYVRGILDAILNNVGPGGAVAIVLLGAWAIVRRPKGGLALLIPTFGLLLTVIKVKYTPDRFYTVGVMALVPFVALCLAEWMREPKWRGMTLGLFGVLAAGNLYFSTTTWEWLLRNEYYAAETYAVANVPKTNKVCQLLTYPQNKGGVRMERLGYEVEVRAVQDWVKTPATAPTAVFIEKRRYDFLLDARKLAGRQKLMERETGFVGKNFEGLEPLGYSKQLVGRPVTWLRPLWFMPAVRDLPKRDLLVFMKAP